MPADPPRFVVQLPPLDARTAIQASVLPSDSTASVSPLPLDTNRSLLPLPLKAEPDPVDIEANLRTNSIIGWCNAERLRHLVNTSMRALSRAGVASGPSPPVCPAQRVVEPEQRGTTSCARAWPQDHQLRLHAQQQDAQVALKPAPPAEGNALPASADPSISKRRRRRLARLEYLERQGQAAAPSRQQIEDSLREVAARQQ